MFDFTSVLLGLIFMGGAAFAFNRTRDALHPAVVLAPMLTYVYCFWPLILNVDGELSALFPEGELDYVGALYLLSGLALYLGILKMPGNVRQLRAIRHGLSTTQNLFAMSMTPEVKKRILYLSLFLGALSLAAYIHMIENVGGFVTAYSRLKGGGRAYSGYVGEAILFSFPAVLLYALSRQGGRKIRFRDVALSLLMSAPHLIQGTFGGRRGPLFLALAVLVLAWFIARGRRPALGRMIVVLSIIGLAVVVVQSQRRHLYLGSGGEFQAERVMETLRPTEDIQNHDFVVGVSTILTVDYFDDYYWGYRYFVTLFIRPIPRQIWPTKYEDMGADWLLRYDEFEGGAEFLQAVGFELPVGSAPGFIADIYHEFGWGVLLVMLILGRGFAWLWKRHCLMGGLWTVIFAEAMILGVYLPTQSLTAWLHRFIFMGLITTLVWKYWIQRRPGRTERRGMGVHGGSGVGRQIR